jgi:metal-sulfur cluster biosynthetic enzyme
MTEFSQPDINQALSKIIHPEINYSLVDLGMIKNVICRQDKVDLTLMLPFVEVPVKDLLIESIKKALSDLDSSIRVKINIEQMSQEQREKFAKMAKEGWKF